MQSNWEASDNDWSRSAEHWHGDNAWRQRQAEAHGLSMKQSWYKKKYHGMTAHLPQSAVAIRVGGTKTQAAIATGSQAIHGSKTQPAVATGSHTIDGSDPSQL